MKLGIIVTCYNNKSALNDCLDSVINLRKKNSKIQFFVVVVDDCSTDDSATLIDQYKKEKKIDVFQRNMENKGVSHSRNQGLLFCKETDYVTFLDADDTVNQEFLKISEKTLWADLVLCNFSYFETQTGLKKEEIFFTCEKHISEIEMVDYLSKYYTQPNKCSLLTTCWAKFYKTTALLQKNKIFFKEDLFLCEDTEFVHRFLSNQTGGVQFLNISFYQHTITSGVANKGKATFGTGLSLSHQLSFVWAVLASRPYMLKNGIDPKLLKNSILHCFGAYSMIYFIRSCLKVRTVQDFYLVKKFWSKVFDKPIFRRALSVYSPKVAGGNIGLPRLVKARLYFFASILAYFICRKRYF